MLESEVPMQETVASGPRWQRAPEVCELPIEERS
jgi:hypothetical protein